MKEDTWMEGVDKIPLISFDRNWSASAVTSRNWTLRHLLTESCRSQCFRKLQHMLFDGTY